MRTVAALLLFLPLARAGDEVDELLARLGRGTSDERRATVEALAGCGPDVVLRVRAIVLGAHPTDARVAAFDVLRRLGAHADLALDDVRTLLGDRHAGVRRLGLEAALAIGPRARPLADLVDAQRDHGNLATLANLAGLSVHARDAEWMRAHLRDPAYRDRLAAALQTAGESGGRAYAVLASSPHPQARDVLVRRIRFASPAPASWIGALRTCAAADVDASLREDAMARLVRRPDESLRAFAEERANDARPRIRALALALLAQLPAHPSSDACIRARLLDDDGRVYGMAALALVLRGEPDRDLRAFAARARGERDPLARGAGALLHLHAGGREPWALDAAAVAVLALGPAGSPPEGALLRTIVPFDAAGVRRAFEPVQGRALVALGRAGRRFPYAALRELARAGGAARDEIDRFREHANAGVRREAVLRLIDVGDRRDATVRALVEVVHEDLRPFQQDRLRAVEALGALGPSALPVLARTAARLDWSGPDEPYRVFLTGVQRIGPRVGDALRRLGYDELADALRRHGP